jgi:iron complex transport system substrate-binding protein
MNYVEFEMERMRHLSSARTRTGRSVFVAFIVAVILTFVFRGAAMSEEDEHVSGNREQKQIETRVITDMAGREVPVPVTVNKVLATSPPPLTFVYMLAPEKLEGWMGPGPANGDTDFVPEVYRDLLVIPRGLSANTYEAYIAAQPDLVIYECEHEFERARIDQVQSQMGTIPVVAFSINETRDMSGYIETIRFIGDLLDADKQADALIAYYNGVLAEVREKVASVPESKRTRAYYAEGTNGLVTDPIGSQHSQLIDVCGGVNVADCPMASGRSRTAVTMESVLLWQPEVIIASSSEFLAYADMDPSWQRIPAVKSGRVHLIPTRPFNWFDRPPGVNRIVGVPWTAHLLYPDLFPDQWLEKKVKEFYSDFYHYELSDDELATLLVD